MEPAGFPVAVACCVVTTHTAQVWVSELPIMRLVSQGVTSEHETVSTQELSEAGCVRFESSLQMLQVVELLSAVYA
jgi:hypothetical protein